MSAVPPDLPPSKRQSPHGLLIHAQLTAHLLSVRTEFRLQLLECYSYRFTLQDSHCRLLTGNDNLYYFSPSLPLPYFIIQNLFCQFIFPFVLHSYSPSSSFSSKWPPHRKYLVSFTITPCRISRQMRFGTAISPFSRSENSQITPMDATAPANSAAR